MDTARIAELLQPFLIPTLSPPCHSEPLAAAQRAARVSEESAVLSPTQLQNISTYIDLLLRWNARINLTAIRHPDEIVTRHFGESLFAARHLFPDPTQATWGQPPSAVRRSAAPQTEEKDPARVPRPSRLSEGGDFSSDRHLLSSPIEPNPADSANDQRPTTNDHVIDVGSGAGFPGLPIKIRAPHIRLTLIESSQKKAIFLREVARALTLTDVNVFAGRAETFAAQNSPAEIVTLRAVERFTSALPTAARLVSPGGRLAILIGRSQVATARELAPQFEWLQPLAVPHSTERVLVIGKHAPE